MKNYGDKIGEKYFKLPKYVQFIISWVVIIIVVGAILWINGKYLHLGNDTEECSGTFEYNCGNVEDRDYRINE